MKIYVQDMQCKYDIINARSRNYCYHGKASVAIKNAKRMRRIISSVTSPRLYHIFPDYLINGTIF